MYYYAYVLFHFKQFFSEPLYFVNFIKNYFSMHKVSLNPAFIWLENSDLSNKVLQKIDFIQ